MYRQVFIPSEQNSNIVFTIPHEWYGQWVELIAFPVATPTATEQKTDEDDFYKLYGAWESDQSPEEMIAELKSARKFRKKDLTF